MRCEVSYTGYAQDLEIRRTRQFIAVAVPDDGGRGGFREFQDMGGNGNPHEIEALQAVCLDIHQCPVICQAESRTGTGEFEDTDAILDARNAAMFEHVFADRCDDCFRIGQRHTGLGRKCHHDQSLAFKLGSLHAPSTRCGMPGWRPYCGVAAASSFKPIQNVPSSGMAMKRS